MDLDIGEGDSWDNLKACIRHEARHVGQNYHNIPIDYPVRSKKWTLHYTTSKIEYDALCYEGRFSDCGYVRLQIVNAELAKLGKLADFQKYVADADAIIRDKVAWIALIRKQREQYAE